MKKYKVLQLGLQLGFPIVMDTCNSWYYTTLSANEQVATDICNSWYLYDLEC